MHQPFQIGDVKTYATTVQEADTAQFGSEQVHPVYATFALARDAEWACRLFVLDMKETAEEGIGVSISVDHQSPALIGEVVTFYATLRTVERNRVHCEYRAYAGQRLVATGLQDQKILNKTRLNQLFESLKSDDI